MKNFINSKISFSIKKNLSEIKKQNILIKKKILFVKLQKKAQKELKKYLSKYNKLRYLPKYLCFVMYRFLQN